MKKLLDRASVGFINNDSEKRVNETNYSHQQIIQPALQ